MPSRITDKDVEERRGARSQGAHDVRLIQELGFPPNETEFEQQEGERHPSHAHVLQRSFIAERQRDQSGCDRAVHHAFNHSEHPVSVKHGRFQRRNGAPDHPFSSKQRDSLVRGFVEN